MKKENLGKAVIAGAATVAAGAAIIAKRQKAKKAAGEGIYGVDMDAKFQEVKEKLEEVEVQVKNATQEPVDNLKITIGNMKGDLISKREDLRIKAEKGKNKFYSELIKAQMNFEAKKAEAMQELEERQYSSEKEKAKAKAIKEVEDASLFMECALEMVEEATVAGLDAVAAAEEYEEKYGEKLPVEFTIQEEEE